jgi:hypothetical protein
MKNTITVILLFVCSYSYSQYDRLTLTKNADNTTSGTNTRINIVQSTIPLGSNQTRLFLTRKTSIVLTPISIETDPIQTFTVPYQTAYYISDTGKLTNDGLSPLKPWPISKIKNNAAFPSGGKYLLEAGKTFKGPILISNFGTVADTTVFGAYGTGIRPVVTTRDTLPGAKNASNWAAAGTNKWRFIPPSTMFSYPRLWLNGVEASRGKDSSVLDATHRMSFINDSPYQKIHVYSITNPALAFTKIEFPGYDVNAMDIANLDRFSVQNLNIQGGRGASLDVEFSTNGKIYNCFVGKDAGHGGIRLNNASNVSFKNVNLNSGDTIKDNFIYQQGVGDGFYVGRGSINIDFGNGVIKNWGHSSVEYTDEGGVDSVRNVRVHHTIISAPDVDYCRPFATNATLARNLLMDSCTITNFTVQSQIAGTNFSFLYNIMDSIKNMPHSYDYSTGNGISFVGYETKPVTGNIVKFNTFRNIAAGAIDLGDPFNNSTYGNISGNEISNNTFSNVGYSVVNPYYEATMFELGVHINIRNNTKVLGNIYANNVSVGSGNPIKYRGVLKTPLQFNAMNGSNGDTISNNQ